MKIGDRVLVSGKLAGVIGTVTDISYSFKIDLSKYEFVVRRVETHIKGEFYLTDNYMLTFDKSALSDDMAMSWFEFSILERGNIVEESDGSCVDLDNAVVTSEVEEYGNYLHFCNNIMYASLRKNQGFAIIEDDGEYYSIDFKFKDNKITDFYCLCYNLNLCEHKYALMLTLREVLGIIKEKYSEEYSKTQYFSLVKRTLLEKYSCDSKVSGKVILE